MGTVYRKTEKALKILEQANDSNQKLHKNPLKLKKDLI